jgi:hypothetical protein
VTGLSPNTIAILERLTDPVIDAVEEVRSALTELSDEITSLKSAIDSEGDECADYLWSLVDGVDTALLRLAAEVEGKYR